MSAEVMRTLTMRLTLFATALLINLSGTLIASEEMKFDLLIKSGRVVDGTGAPWYSADIGVRNGKIAAIGHLDSGLAKETLDAEGLVVSPGFIDMMGQTATPMMENPNTAKNLLLQGITTINAGEGSSQAPLDRERSAEVGWETMAEYFQLLDLKGFPVNVAQTIGHTQVRRIVLGDEFQRPNSAQLDSMKALVREAMEAGAIGVSTALIYPPAIYARTDEIAELASVAGEYGGRYYTHMRNEGDQLLEAIDEAIEIGRTASAPVHIFHLKAAGRQNWGKMQLAIAKIKQARSEGQQVAADIYPYIHNGLGLEALIHPRHFTRGKSTLMSRLDESMLRAEIKQEMLGEGEWENWFRHAGSNWDRIIIGNSRSERYQQWHGESVAHIAKEVGEDPWDTFFNLVRENSFAMPETMTEANLLLAIKEPFVSFCTDVGPASSSRSVSHPRSHGAFPRLISRYVRDLGAITLEQAISQATANAANEIMARDRGRIAVGLAADLAVFDYEDLADKATAAEPRAMSEGVRHVVVNGVTVLRDGEMTGRRPGRVLRGPGYDPKRHPHRVMTGKRDERLVAIDELMQAYLREQNAPGASLAITDQGRLVYARGFGYADVAAGQKVEPTSLFRIASISKPITAVAIMQLVEAGKLDLDSPVFSILTEYSPIEQEGYEPDPRQESITIRHLLQHRGGWDRDVSFDGMFQSLRFARATETPPPASQTAIIRCMLGLPLDFEPGERYAYSNYGYCLLGRVIEAISGVSYEQYVRDNVLTPAGVHTMAIGASHLEGRRSGEVRYYDNGIANSVFANRLGKRTPAAYGAWYLESMDSHGAWIASAVDLLRFSSSIDNHETGPLKKAASIKSLFARPPGLAGKTKQGEPKETYYGLGWQVRCDNQGNPKYIMHGGSLPGTSTKLVRRSDGRSFALLFNARNSAKARRLAESVLLDLHQAIDEMEVSPETDFFQAYE